ncbi:MAG: mechanosensitive ion channel family protein [Desulfovibrionales bacterium]|nr:mechanosensitive ion channel family protein [Desulfovibrionales bacterium]
MSVRNQIITVLLIIVISCALLSVSRAAEPVTAVPPDATGEQIHEIMAGMSDAQVRALLLEELGKEVQERAALQSGVETAVSFTQMIVHMQDRFEYLFGSGVADAEKVPDVLYKAVSGNGKVAVWELVQGIVLLTVVWIIVRLLYRRRTLAIRKLIETTPQEWGFFRKIFRLFLRAGLDLFGILVSSIVILVVYMLFFQQGEAAKPILIAWFFAMLLADVSGLLARFVLVPRAEGLRYLPLKNATAMTVYHWTLWISRFGAFGLLVSFLILLQGEAERWYLLSLAFTGLVVVCGISLLVAWEARNGTLALRQSSRKGSIKYQLAGIWHVLLISCLFIGWAIWLVVLMVKGSGAILPAIATLLSVPVYCIVNWLAQQLVNCMSGVAQSQQVALAGAGCGGNEERGVELEADGSGIEDAVPVGAGEAPFVEVTQDIKAPVTTVERFRRVLRASFRIAIFSVIIVTLFHLWGIHLPIGLATARSFIGILFTVVTAYIIWGFINMAIERKITAQPEEAVDSGGEGGSGGGDRFATLLQLLRKFLFGFMLIVVSLIILSSLGIDITPLLAGASVFGLAIGFGAQTLVKDVISGIFFLMDDAFRVNDYIQVGDSMGTVEEISIRSLKLRHHRGALFTIPFGTIGNIMNMSRGFAIMKLEYLVPFDTDVNHVKKIMKRINKEVRENPEYDALLIDDIKSQGVKSIDQYGLRMRVKFTTKPGGQWTIRKIVYAKMRRIFKEEGIEFARPSVAVHVPDGGSLTPEQEQDISVAAQNLANDTAQAQAQKNKK